MKTKNKENTKLKKGNRRERPGSEEGENMERGEKGGGKGLVEELPEGGLVVIVVVGERELRDEKVGKLRTGET